MSGFPTTTTYSSLVDEIISNLRGYSSAPDQMTFLTANLYELDERIKVDDIMEVSKGVIEIGSELIYVKSVDTASSEAVTQWQWRGFRGTAAELHSFGQTVTYAPIFPRSVVQREINNVIQSIYPLVFGVKSYEFTPTGVAPQYDIPVGANRVMDVNQYLDAYLGWERIRSWDVRQNVGTPSITGVQLDLFGRVLTGRRVRVLYAVKPTPMVNPTDVFTTVTGLPEAAKDIVLFGVAARLAGGLDIARLPVATVEADELGQTRAVGSAMQVASSFYKLYQAALERERQRLNELYPARIHLVR